MLKTIFPTAVLVLGLFNPVIDAAIVDVIVGPGGSLAFTPTDVIIDLGDTVRLRAADVSGHDAGVMQSHVRHARGNAR